jgi:hypothetical protein
VGVLAVLADGSRGVGANSDEGALSVIFFQSSFDPETHTKRQATQHGCLPSLLGDGNKRIETVYGEEKNTSYWAD